MKNFFNSEWNNWNKYLFGLAIMLGTIAVASGILLGILNLLTGGF